MAKIYVIKDIEENEVVGITEDKKVLDLYLEKRDPNNYEWVKIKDKHHIELTKSRYSDCSLIDYGDFAISQLEFECVQEMMMSIPPSIMHEIYYVMDKLKYLKLTKDEEEQLKESLAIVYSLFRTIEDPPAYLDGVIDETNLIDEYLLAKKYFMEECL